MYQETDNGDRLVKKPTGFMTSSRFVAEELNKYCDGSHDHVHLMSGKLTAAAQVYPPDLCKAMLRGTRKQKIADTGLDLKEHGLDEDKGDPVALVSN